ncbi:MAG: hypothetical protein Q7K35_00970 [bacterium]|nr:hypothetical protein [bacterium]
MLEKFWDKNKHIINLAAILVAVGAIFLTIPLPQNEEAKKYLINVQLFWLVIISIMIVVILVLFYLFSIEIEKKIEEKKFNINGALSTLIFMSALWFMGNLWKYILVLYKEQYLKLASNLGYAITLFYFGLLVFVSEKIIPYYFSNNKKKFFSLFAITALLGSMGVAFIEAIINLNFDIIDWVFATEIKVISSIIIIFIKCEITIRRTKNIKGKNPQ